MKIEDKIEELNKFCDGTLNIIHFTNWEVISYGKGTFFELRPTEERKRIRATTFRKVVNLAYAEKKKEERE